MHFHTVAVDFLPPQVIGANMRRIATMLAQGEVEAEAASCGFVVAALASCSSIS